MHQPIKSEPEPDIEDCVASSTKINAFGKQLVHDNALHGFDGAEIAYVQRHLLLWYDRNRRRLPWRGDPPPYLSTAEHTKSFLQAKEAPKPKIMKKITDLFFKPQSKQSTHLEPTNDAVDDADEVKDEQTSDDSSPLSQSHQHMSRQSEVTPYQTWVSEIMCQQTRVDTVVEYFTRWMRKFPTVAALAEADEEEVNALWAGLGYYRRARMLHAGARYVMENFNGELPSTVDQLLTIPGIGQYTAGAIASIAFGKQTALVDGNVIRVIARLRAIGADPKHKPLITHTWKQAQELVTGCERPGDLNQALMELGATVCTTQTASCGKCPVKEVCLSYHQVETHQLILQYDNDSNAEEGKSVPPASSDCTICDWSRSDEWREVEVDVCTFPLRAKKNTTKNESFSVGVITAGRIPGHHDPLASSVASNSKTETQFLMSKRPPNGLLAGQLEFVHVQTSKENKIMPLKRRQRLLDDQMRRFFVDYDSSTRRDSSVIVRRRDLGSLSHVFSHVTHHMGIEHVHLQQPLGLQQEPGSTTAGSTMNNLQWMTLKEIKQAGITTGVQKILNLVLNSQDSGSKAPGIAKTKAANKKRTSSSSSSASKRSRQTSKMKPLTSFFKS